VTILAELGAPDKVVISYANAPELRALVREDRQLLLAARRSRSQAAVAARPYSPAWDGASSTAEATRPSERVASQHDGVSSRPLSSNLDFRWTEGTVDGPFNSRKSLASGELTVRTA
jgi:hypothetical protein